MVRRPASVLGGPWTCLPSVWRTQVRSILIVSCKRSTSCRCNPRISPRRSWHHAASNGASRYRAGTAATATASSATVATGRSVALSEAAFFTLHGERPMRSSSTAVRNIAAINRYAPAAVAAWPRFSLLCHVRIELGVTDLNRTSPNVGKMCRSRRWSYLERVVGLRVPPQGPHAGSLELHRRCLRREQSGLVEAPSSPCRSDSPQGGSIFRRVETGHFVPASPAIWPKSRLGRESESDLL